MARATWSYLQNPFDFTTQNSKKNMFLMATDHFDKLYARSTDANIAALYVYGKPFFDDFSAQYRKTKNDAAIYRMHTMKVQSLLKKLQSTLIRQWDIKIQAVLDKNSADYLGLLPKGRIVFQTGAIEFRISAVKILANRLEDYPLLSALRSEIEDFYTQILQERSEQQGVELLVQSNVGELEKTRAALAQAMHAILAGLTQLYIGNLAKVESFYELRYLRKKAKKKNKGAVDKGLEE